MYKKTKEARRKKIWKPKVKIILEKLKRNNVKNCSYVDIGGGYGIFAEEMSKEKKSNVVVIEPSPFMADECRAKKINVIQKFLESVKKEDLPKKKKCFTCFELFEHLHNPSKFIKNLRKYDAFDVFDSNANFVLFDAKGADTRVYNALIEQGISIRKLGKLGSHKGCLRVTIGTSEMNSKFLLAIRDLLE